MAATFQDCAADPQAASTALAWQSVMLEVLVTIVLETELDSCVTLIEALKFWRQLAQMTKFRRRFFYPALHLREGGIRRTALRRAARLEGMLADRAAKASTLHRLLMRIRALAEPIIDPCAPLKGGVGVGVGGGGPSAWGGGVNGEQSREDRAWAAQRTFLSHIDNVTEETLATIYAVRLVSSLAR
jgi:hypothetical protein